MKHVLLLLLVTVAGDAMSDDHAVILAYHHVSTETPASTSVTPSEFRRHLDYLDENGFTVMALGDIVQRFQSGQPVPDKTVAITFDDAYKSVITTAAPELKKRGWPFTVFVATEAIDQGLQPFLSWEELRELVSDGVEIGNHSARHRHMIRRDASLRASQWLQEQRDDIEAAQRRIEEELDVRPRLFAFPYGEYNQQLVELLKRIDLTPVGQHSGAASAASVVLPRFPVSSRYASIDTLADKLQSVPFVLQSVRPRDGVLAAADSRPVLTLEFVQRPKHPKSLQCFVSGQENAKITWVGQVASVQARQALRPGRTKYNCTLPSTTEAGRFHWFSFVWMRPVSPTAWYSE